MRLPLNTSEPWGGPIFVAFLLLALLPGIPARNARAQSVTPVLQPDKVPFDFYERGIFRREVPRPATVLGYEPGAFHTTYANYERYLRDLTPKTDRLRVFTIGETAEHRPLYLLAISSPENLDRLDAIKKDLALLADPRKCSEEEAAAIAARSPMAVWLSYSIHGDESSAFEAGMQVLYQLTASENVGILEILKQCVVLINPAQNPDGHERFTAWYNAHGLGRPEAFAFEHRQPWGIWGRFNHYLFDLNRDLLPASQIESRAQMAQFLAWHPQVNADHHGETKISFSRLLPYRLIRRCRASKPKSGRAFSGKATPPRSTGIIGCTIRGTCSTCTIPGIGIAGRACTDRPA